uniref:Uncharacterized protein n=1 Tax=Cacopsylla melanoneura TaxID=428564 RepID=A0A8D9C291_9HEMI
MPMTKQQHQPMNPVRVQQRLQAQQNDTYPPNGQFSLTVTVPQRIDPKSNSPFHQGLVQGQPAFLSTLNLQSTVDQPAYLSTLNQSTVDQPACQLLDLLVYP